MGWALVRKNGDTGPYMIYRDPLGRRWRLTGSKKPNALKSKGTVLMTRLGRDSKTDYRELYTREFNPGFFGLKWVWEDC